MKPKLKNLKPEFIATLKLNGYYTLNGGKSYHKSCDRREKSFTFLGGEWVEVYEREYPASEGWSMFKTTIAQALKHHIAL